MALKINQLMYNRFAQVFFNFLNCYISDAFKMIQHFTQDHQMVSRGNYKDCRFGQLLGP